MLLGRLILFLFCLNCASFLAYAKKGILELDEKTFDKVVDGSKHVLVAFVEYSWKDPTDYDKVAEEFAQEANAIVAKVDCNDNQELKSRFGAVEYPTVLYFAQGSSAEPQKYEGEVEGFALIDFFKSCLDTTVMELRQIAGQFLASGDRPALVTLAEEKAAQLGEATSKYGKYFVTNMKKIMEKGSQFVQAEKERLQGLMNSKSTTKEKQKEFATRKYILGLFSPAEDE